MPHVRSCQTTIIVALCSSCFGCGDGLVDVKGKVTLDGVPVEGAAVTLHPDTTNQIGRTSSGVTDANGTVRFTTFEQYDGVPAGSYKVVVLKAPANIDDEFANADRNDPDVLLRMAQRKAVGNLPYTPSVLPRIYLNPQRTPLECEVTPKSEEVTFALESTAGN